MTQIVNLRNNLIIADNVKIAKTFLARFLGLIPYSALGRKEALVIQNCNCVHTFFMRFSIDIVFCSKDNEVLFIEHNLRTWRVSSFCSLSSYVIELVAGSAKRDDIQVGDMVTLTPTY